MTKRWLAGIAALILAALAYTPIAQAATASPAGLTIAPFYQEVKIQAGEASKNFTVDVTNNSKTAEDFHVSALDFGSLDETGGLVFAGANANSLISKYGLASWLSVDQPDISLAPNGKATITATLTNRDDLSPGGHYAALIIASKNNPTDTNNIQVDLNQTLSSLIFATKIGGEKYGLTLDKPKAVGTLLNLPKNVSLKFHNTGNTHIVPRGIVWLIDPRGRQVEKGIINTESSFILPERSRIYDVSLGKLSLGFWPGRYHLKTQYRYDGEDKFTEVDQSFIYLSPELFLVFVLAVLGLAYLVLKKNPKILKKRPKNSNL